VTLAIKAVPRPEWSPLPREGCRNVDGKVLLLDGDFFISILRFGRDGTIDEHAGETDAHVICLEGRGWTSVGNEKAELRAGESVFWPAQVEHRLWTEDSEMVTLMVHPPRDA
jgi:quercetin dioxygenase-like cupin family protein